ncbi:hypothetical protein HYW75_01715 [Candidatus Pacearchaeota archaeon]|nr:hypothetical protein [Candidatus Pacearchaeota archaeon]
MTKILIIEDQKGPLMALEYALNEIAQNYLPNLTQDVARCYNEGEAMIKTRGYDLVLLDNRMSYENQVELEKRDFRQFCSKLEDIGYNLIPFIRKTSPTTIVIGTSSMSDDELRRFERPDFIMRKSWGDAAVDLESILKQINEGVKK